MTIGEYQRKVERARRPLSPPLPPPFSLLMATVGLTGEAGEVANEVKKAVRDSSMSSDHLVQASEVYRNRIAAELGDVLWYAARVATEIGRTLETIAEDSLEKAIKRGGPEQ